ncbi:DUF3857 domain-containing protein [Hydrogenophaga flava]|uniref:DUF3857 domain-containing protein n=1 Tax=Hydrogenophaga flava TaxID=65657 RepID=UPI0014726B91|nr:DUF3857 domain-containing protein [Hydrogenophaga flava]
MYYLLVDRQTRASGSERHQFNRVAIKVVNEKGMEHAASIDIDFDPSFQRLQLHTLAVHRNGRALSQLATVPIRTLQREKELEALVLDGRLTSSLLVQDVRVGDVVEYAYSVRGVHPSMKGGHFGGFDMQWRDPVHAVYQRLLWPAGRPITFRNINLDNLAVESEQGGVRQYEWTARQVPGLRVSNNAPVWFDPYPSVQWSSFRDWSEVSRWAVPLYAPPAVPGGELSHEVERIRQTLSDPRDQVAAVLQYVQKNIRYLSVDVGVGSYTPSPPATVMARRFGDCKDKTLLTLTMLKALGIEARAALVNTRIREGVAQRVPSPGAFDHVLVRVQVNGQIYWIDPTRYPQMGRLDDMGQPYFGVALIIDPSTQDLEPMPRSDATRDARSVSTVFDATQGLGQPVTATITTDYQGLSAEWMRDRLSRSNRDELQRQYLNFYAGYYPGVVAEGPMTIEDDQSANAIKVVERYRIADFWTKGHTPGALEARVRTPDMLSQLQEPDEQVRNAPLAIGHITEVDSITDVHLPEDWQVESDHSEVRHPAFEFTYTLTTTPRLLTQVGRYVSLSDHVKTEDMADYVKKLEEARSVMWLKLTYTPGAAATPAVDTEAFARLESFGWPVAVYFLLLAAASYWIARKMYRYNPQPALPESSAPGQPLGGWLIVYGGLLAFGVASALKYSWPFVSVFLSDVWAVVRSAGAPGEAPKTTWTDLFSIGVVVIVLTPYVVQLPLYFARRTSVPRVTFWLQGVLSILGLILVAAAFAFGDRSMSGSELAWELVEATLGLIGCVYIQRSVRAKATFARRYGVAPGLQREPPVQPDAIGASAP